MGTRISRFAVAAALVATWSGACSDNPRKDAPITSKNEPQIATPPSTIGAPGENVVTEFNQRIKEYVALQKELLGTLKRLPSRATPLQIDANQRALGALIAKARSDAKLGDIFVAPMQAFIRGLVRSVLNGPDGGKIKDSLMDENPMGAKIEVNSRYPDTIPLSTMPPDLLAALPRLPEDLEYRFVGTRLILLDTRSHLIVDFVENTFDM